MPDAARRPGFSLEDAVLDIGGDIGALIVYTDAGYEGREIELSLIEEADDGTPGDSQEHQAADEPGHSREHGHEHEHGRADEAGHGPEHADEHGHEHEPGQEHAHAHRVHTAIHERRAGGSVTYAGIYPELPAGTYRIWGDDPTLPNQVTIVGGEVAELDWRTPPD